MDSSISLVIAYYNGSQFVEEAIKSAFVQTTPFNEIIVVDDGSSQEETDRLLDLNRKYQFVYIRKENGGQGSARNVGCERAASRYVCFLDQDDILLPDHNTILISKLKEFPKYKDGWVYGNFSVAQSNGQIFSRKGRPVRQVDTNKTLYNFLAEDIFMLPSASLICRQSLLLAGGFDEQFRGYEDDDLFIRLFRNGRDCLFVDEEVYVWRMHENQTSASRTMLKSRMKFIEKWLDNEYDRAVNRRLISRLLLNRFKRTVLTDVLLASSREDLAFAKSIARDFSGKFGETLRFYERWTFRAFSLLPRRALGTLVEIARNTIAFKRALRKSVA